MPQFDKAKQFYLQILAIALGILLIGQAVSAQTKTTAPDRGFSPGKSYAISDIESISMQSGGVILNMPLGSLPAGRGGMSAGINLSYNSKLWDMISFDDLDAQGVPFQRSTLASSQEGGWHYGYKYYFRVDAGHDDNCTFNSKIQLVMPDGGTHTLVPGDGANALSNEDNYSIINPDGRSACSGTEVAPGGTVRLFSIDSSFLRMEVITDGDRDINNNQWTLYMADGTRVVNRPQAGISQRIYDHNDNYIDVIENGADTLYSNHQTTSLQDALGRKVVIEYNAAASEDWIHSNGFAGTDIITRVQWKGITINKTYMSGDFTAPSPRPPNFYREFPFNQSSRVVDKIYPPSQISGNLYYGFQYNADTTSAADVGWGEISQVKLPSGATANYEYQYDNVTGSTIDTETVLKNGITKKTLAYNLEYDGATPPTSDVWTYQRSGLDPIISGQMTAPDGSTTTEYYTGYSTQTYPAQGELYKTESSGGTVIERWYQSNAPGVSNVPGYPNTLFKANRYVKYEFVSIKDAAGTLTKTAIKDFTYDKNGNTTQVKEYDFVPYSSVPRNADGKPYALPSNAATYLKRISVSEYYNQTPEASQASYTDQNIYSYSTAPKVRNAVKSAEAQDASGTPKSRSEMFYDNLSTPTNGNLTESRTWDSYKNGTVQAYNNPLTTSNSVSSTVQYNSYGSPTLTTDAKGNQTQITYGSVNGYTDLYPTQTITAYGTPIQRTSTAQYDFYTGLVTTATDVDNNVSSATVYDALGRPTIAKAAINTPQEVWAQTEYDDANRRITVRSDLFVKGDAKKVATQFYDQLGRVRLSKTLEDAATQSATNETDGIKVQTRYQTGNPNSYQLTSNPYRAATSMAATSEPSMGWTRSKSVNTGKHSEVETFSGSSLPAPWGSNTSSSGVVSTDIDADRTLVTDQSGKQRISRTNALGQMTDVWEITASDASTVAVSFPNQILSAGYQTSYVYDTLNNLITVNQGVQQPRSFAYSSLGRLRQAQNPESGLIQYAYDANGNLTSKTDARNVATTFSYDNLNRVLSRSYSDATPQVTYTYENASIPFSKGRLTKVSSSVSQTEYNSFDVMGRILSHKQTTDGAAYTTAYNYNLSGALVEETYPSTRVVKNVLDNNGDLEIVQSKKNANQGYFDYAKNFSYTAAGAVSSMQLGNSRWESTVFNSRLQPTQIALGTVQNGTDKLKLNYDYGATNNNGNVLSQQITVPTTGNAAGFTASQTYAYDSLNRLKSAQETIGGAQSWKQTFIYDRYGNRNFDTANTTTLGGCPANQCNPIVDVTNNRFTTGQGYTFDLAGNVVTDAQGRTFNFDAENKQTKVISGGQTVGTYFYDGDGKRVKKVVGTETTIFVYDGGGKMVAEYTTSAPTTAQVSYLTSDHLGSPRINTDANGNVMARHDYMPFGEEIDSTITSQRNVNLNYGDDGIKNKFTSYERDNETDLDFAEARMYANQLGRFTTTDPILMEPDRAFDPQRINLYAYVRNNPLTLVDPTGEIIDDSSLDNNKNYQKWKKAFLATKNGQKLWDKYQNDRNFTLTIGISKDKGNGAETHDYKFADGKLVGATITLGNKIDSDVNPEHAKPSDAYPISSSLGKASVDGVTMAVAVIAHEFGHVEDASQRPELFQQIDEYNDTTKKLNKDLGANFGVDPRYKAAEQKVLKAGGYKSMEEMSIDNDHRAERTMIPVIQQHYANTKNKIPKNVQKAIDNFTRSPKK
jgi:RHS repeat-associated protein